VRRLQPNGFTYLNAASTDRRALQPKTMGRTDGVGQAPIRADRISNIDHTQISGPVFGYRSFSITDELFHFAIDGTAIQLRRFRKPAAPSA
jgi:hypothetical protein